MIKEQIPYGRQCITQEDIDAVVNVLKSDFLTQGPMVPAFEHAISNYCGSEFAIATNSATSALHIACLAFDLTEEDEVWTSPNSFVASSNCALYCNAKVNFVDIELETGNICILSLKNKLKNASLLNKTPKVLIVVHFAGQSCDMQEIKSLSLKYGFRIIEDASHAIGGDYQGNKIGCCQYSDICVFSFHPVKIITSGEGGMALTNDANLASKMRLFRSHGITRNILDMKNDNNYDWYYEQISLGFNYRMTDICAALGLRQLDDLDLWVEKRNLIASVYDEAFRNTSIKPLCQKMHRKSAYHLYVIRLENIGEKDKKSIFDQLRQRGIGVNVHYIPIHLHPYYQKLGFKNGDYPISEKYYIQAITLPLYPGLKDLQQEYIIKNVMELVNN